MDAKASDAQLVVGARLLRQHEHAVALVQRRAFLRNEVHAISHRVHEQDVVGAEGGDRAREVVVDVHHDRLVTALSTSAR